MDELLGNMHFIHLWIKYPEKLMILLIVKTKALLGSYWFHQITPHHRHWHKMDTFSTHRHMDRELDNKQIAYKIFMICAVCFDHGVSDLMSNKDQYWLEFCTDTFHMTMNWLEMPLDIAFICCVVDT